MQQEAQGHGQGRLFRVVHGAGSGRGAQKGAYRRVYKQKADPDLVPLCKPWVACEPDICVPSNVALAEPSGRVLRLYLRGVFMMRGEINRLYGAMI